MNLIDTISDEASQLLKVQLNDGSEVQLLLTYRAASQRWTLDVLWQDFEANGINICVHPNFMRPWLKLIPFGLSCLSDDLTDPVYFNDFSSGRCQLYVLDEDDVAATEADIRAS